MKILSRTQRNFIAMASLVPWKSRSILSKILCFNYYVCILYNKPFYKPVF
uniref:Uncharacterized protein n=1 Tax=Ciona intestinalis TaxID=7719 RepID=H2XWK8_CIOIN